MGQRGDRKARTLTSGYTYAAGFDWYALAQQAAEAASEDAYRNRRLETLELPMFEWQKETDARDYAKSVADDAFSTLAEAFGVWDRQRQGMLQQAELTGGIPNSAYWNIMPDSLKSIVNDPLKYLREQGVLPATTGATTGGTTTTAAGGTSSDAYNSALAAIFNARPDLAQDYEQHWIPANENWNQTKRDDEDAVSIDQSQYMRDWLNWNFPTYGLNAGGTGAVPEQEVYNYAKTFGWTGG